MALVGKYLIRFELVRVASAAREIVHVGEGLVERCPPTGLEVSPCTLPQVKGRKKIVAHPFFCYARAYIGSAVFPPEVKSLSEVGWLHFRKRGRREKVCGRNEGLLPHLWT